ncbi:MAG: two-component regulator propeller domain-containing protein [Thermoanaerobaculia bacterium]|jgi:signal transduction histidine kinase/ligand-binding sensor domain-containing protein
MNSPRAIVAPTTRASALITRILLASVVLLATLPLVALEPDRAISQYAHRAWRIEDGLPHSVVRGITQTDDGYLWIATYEGLARFNGDSFTRYNKTNLPGFRRDTVLSLLKARDGSVWIGTNGGGGGRLLGGKADSFLPLSGLPSEIVAALTEGRDGSIWVGTSEGLVVWRNGRIENPVAIPEIGNRSILSLTEAPDGTLWIGTRSGGLFSLRNGSFRGEGFDGRSVHTLRTDPDGTLWVGAGDGLFTVGTKGTMRVDAIPVDQVTSILRDTSDTIWVGTYAHGLWRLAADGSVDHFGAREGLLNNSVRSLFEDAERTLWVGTNSGLESFIAGKFVTIGPREGLSDAYTRSVFQDSAGDVWIGTAQGLNRISGNETKAFTTADGLSSDYVFAIGETPDGAIWIGTSRGVNRLYQGRFTSYQEKDGIPSPTVRSVHCDRSGTLWIGTDSGALRFVNGKFERVNPLPGWDTTYVQAFAEAADGALWFGSDGSGLARLSNGTFTVWTEEEGLPDGHILSLLLDRNGTLWIGTDSAGLIRMKDGRFTQYTTAIGLPSDKILQMLEDDQGRLWAGGGNGIWYASIVELDSYAAGKVTSVATTTFGTGEGIRSVQCNGSVSPSAIRTRDGHLWFPTVDGVATILPQRAFPKNARKPPVKIETVVIDGKAVPTGGEIDVEPGARQLEVHYAALTYHSPQAATFRYRLEGFDKQWIEAGTRRTAYYTGVPPGRYRFQVIAANADGVWNEDGAKLAIRLEPRFVQTIWFPLLIVGAASLLVLLLHLRRVRSMSVREAELVKLVEQRTGDIRLALDEAHAAREIAESQGRLLAEALVEAEAASRAKSTFLANVSHELRTPLNAIIGFAHVLQQSAASKLDEKQRRFMHNIAMSGEHLLRLINEILDLAKIEAGKITVEPEEVEIAPLLESVAHTARGLMVERGVEFEVVVADGVTTVVADPTKLKQIVYNLVSNAAKFSPQRSTVRIDAKPLRAAESPLARDSVAISVADTGVGIHPDYHEEIFEEFRQLATGTEKPAGTGLGLALVKKFVELLQGSIVVDSEPGKGSTFTVVIPLQQVETLSHSGSDEIHP